MLHSDEEVENNVYLLNMSYHIPDRILLISSTYENPFSTTFQDAFDAIFHLISKGQELPAWYHISELLTEKSNFTRRLLLFRQFSYFYPTSQLARHLFRSLQFFDYSEHLIRSTFVYPPHRLPLPKYGILFDGILYRLNGSSGYSELEWEEEVTLKYHQQCMRYAVPKVDRLLFVESLLSAIDSNEHLLTQIRYLPPQVGRVRISSQTYRSYIVEEPDEPFSDELTKDCSQKYHEVHICTVRDDTFGCNWRRCTCDILAGHTDDCAATVFSKKKREKQRKNRKEKKNQGIQVDVTIEEVVEDHIPEIVVQESETVNDSNDELLRIRSKVVRGFNDLISYMKDKCDPFMSNIQRLFLESGIFKSMRFVTPYVTCHYA